MQRWLAVAAASWLLVSPGAHAQIKGLGAVEIAEVAKNHTIDLRIPERAPVQHRLPLVEGMLLHEQLAPNAVLGLGLANIYARRRNSDFRSSDRAVRSRKPAVTFVFKF